MVDDEKTDILNPVLLKRQYVKILKILTITILASIIIILILSILSLTLIYDSHNLWNDLISMFLPIIIVAGIPYIVILLAYLNEKNKLKQTHKFKCPECGNQNRMQAKFCDKCGLKLTYTTEADL